MFLHTHVHSEFSVRDGLLKLEEAIKASKENGEAFAITDHGVIAGWIKLSDLAKKYDVKPVYGVEVYVNQKREELLKVVQEAHDEKDTKLRKKIGEKRDLLKSEQHHLILIAKNQKGAYNIIKIVNDAYVNFFYSRPLIDYDTLFANKEGIIVCTACLAGPINKLNNADKDTIEYVEMMKEQFGDDFYLEVQANGIKEQKVLNKLVIDIAKKTNTKIVIGSDSHYLNPKDADTHQDLLLLQNKQTRNDLGKIDTRVVFENKNGETKVKRVKSGGEFRKGVLVDHLEPGMQIGKETIVKVEEIPRVWTFSSDKINFKNFAAIKKDVNKSHKELVEIIDEVYKTHCKIYDDIEYVNFNTELKLPQVENAAKEFLAIIKQKTKEKGFVDRKYIDRIKYELSVIRRFGFETYFLILYDLIEYARKEGVSIGMGRGSVAGSLIAYLIDLHKINPFDERWDTTGEGLPFERFLDVSKLYNKIVIEDGSGTKLELLEIDDVNVKRDGGIILIKANEIKEGDEVILE